MYTSNTMAKQKKKRNKVYTGNDATNVRPVVTHISAVNRGRVGQWWFERKKFARPILIAAGILFVVILLVIGLVSLIHF